MPKSKPRKVKKVVVSHEIKDFTVEAVPLNKIKVQEPVLPGPVSQTPVKEVLEPLQLGQKYFEAPDGTIVIGEADKNELWYRKLNNGRGGFINPKRS